MLERGRYVAAFQAGNYEYHIGLYIKNKEITLAPNK